MATTGAPFSTQLGRAATLAIALSNCGGSSTSEFAENNNVTLAGTVSVAAADAASAALPRGARALSDTGTALSNATVTLVKIYADGTEDEVGATTTNASGAYAFANVDVAEGGNGAASDFYYELRAEKSGVDVRAPVAPTANTTINISPATNLAAQLIANVVDVPTLEDAPTVRPELIEATRELVQNNIDTLEDNHAIALPSVDTAGENDTTALANGLAAGGGNAEKMYKAMQFESEAVGLIAAATPAISATASYLKRVMRESCNQPSANPLPMAAAEVFAQALLDGTTYTPSAIVAAYNAVAATDAVLSTAVSAYQTLLTDIEAHLTANADSATALTVTEQIALYTKRDLTAAGFTASTALEADQALAFLMSLGSSGCSFTGVDISRILADLSDDSGLTAAHIADVQVFHDSGFGCNQNAGEGHFRADVRVSTPSGVTVTSATISSSDNTALDGDGTVSLTQSGDRWISQTNSVCVTLVDPVTYTLTVNLSNTEVLTNNTITRNHPLIPEAVTSVEGAASSPNNNAPTVVTITRPVYSWESPATKLAAITSPPAGSKVKYTYEFSHVDVTDSPVSPLGQCDSVTSGALYEVDSFIPTVDCDVAACATASSNVAENIRCRMNIQTYLVDESDRYLGQATGHFPVFCVDTNDDADCGN